MSDDRWREGSVAEQMKHMLESGLLSDCSFLVGQEPDDSKEFKAHKNIMSRSSEVFYTMFYGALSEKDVVRVTDVTPEVFQALLYHVYSDILEVSDVNMALGLCSAAHKYLLQPLVNKCTDYIGQHMGPGNVWQLLEFSNLTNNIKLQQHCIKMLQSCTDEVLNADSWCDVDVSCVVTLLQQDDLNVESELPLLLACQRWALHQLNINNQPDVNNGKNDKDMNVKLREIAGPLVPYIRVLSLTGQQFAQSTGNSISIYSEKEQNMIFKCLLDPLKHKISEGLCEINTARKNNVSVSHKVPQINKDSIDKLISCLENKYIHSVKFGCVGNYYGALTDLKSTLCIHKNIVIYGFQFYTVYLDAQKDRFPATINNNEWDYSEKFTLYFMKENDDECLAKFDFDGKLEYDDKVNFYFPKPFLAKENTNIQIILQFNHCKRREYQSYSVSSDKLYDVFTLKKGSYLSCLSQILYKNI